MHVFLWVRACVCSIQIFFWHVQICYGTFSVSTFWSVLESVAVCCVTYERVMSNSKIFATQHCGHAESVCWMSVSILSICHSTCVGSCSLLRIYTCTFGPNRAPSSCHWERGRLKCFRFWPNHLYPRFWSERKQHTHLHHASLETPEFGACYHLHGLGDTLDRLDWCNSQAELFESGHATALYKKKMLTLLRVAEKLTRSEGPSPEGPSPKG